MSHKILKIDIIELKIAHFLKKKGLFIEFFKEKKQKNITYNTKKT